jgi:hypothetical protein
MQCRGKSRYCRRISDNGGVLTEKYRSTGLTREVEDRWCVACICAITILTIFGLQSRLQTYLRQHVARVSVTVPAVATTEHA